MTELVEHGKLFNGGELTDPLGGDADEVVSPPGGGRRTQGLRRRTLAAGDAALWPRHR